MLIRIESEVLEKYPKAEVGYLVAQVSVRKIDPYVDHLKQSLLANLESKGINATNFVVHPNIAIWRKIYREDFLVHAKSHRSSIEALLKRVVTGKEIWNICNVVDLYNCCSILSLLPMGGYDLDKVSGDIAIRYSREGETFHGLGERQKIETKTNHVVYADDKRVMCWLWNHKDSAETCIDENTKRVVFFIDAAEGVPNILQSALVQLSENLEQIQCIPLDSGVLNRETPYATLNGLER